MHLALTAILMAAIPGCAGDDETALRDRLDRWFSLGETVSFLATRDCMAAAFRLVQAQVKSPLTLAGSTPEALRSLQRRGAVALDDPSLSPDAALVEFVNADRPTGMAIRLAALEGRACMDPQIESAFRYALDNPRAMLAYDGDNTTLMLLDPDTGLLVAARGAPQWRW